MSDDNARNAATFGAIASAYAAGRPRYPESLFDFLAAQAPARGAAWDAGCGNGQATASLASRFARVLGTDMSAEQVAQAPALPNVEWRVASSEEVDVAPASLDLVLVAQALHWFDLDRFYPRVQRALAPRGVFAAVGYSWFRVDPAIDAQVKALVLDPLRPFWAQGNATLWRGYAQLPFPFEPIEAPPTAIELDWTLAQMMAYVDTWSAVKRMRSETGVDVVAAAAERLAPLWGEGARRVTMPLTLRVGRKAAHAMPPAPAPA
jgi:SAM-dependent methyltransferase